MSTGLCTIKENCMCSEKYNIQSSGLNSDYPVSMVISCHLKAAMSLTNRYCCNRLRPCNVSGVSESWNLHSNDAMKETLSLWHTIPHFTEDLLVAIWNSAKNLPLFTFRSSNPKRSLCMPLGEKKLNSHQSQTKLPPFCRRHVYNPFSWMAIIIFRFKFHRNWISRIHLMISYHCFR